MAKRISNDVKSVQFVYEDYISGNFIVNRRYQRKLVWTLSEKQAFIDSLIRGYSVPLFLFAQESDTVSSDKWEILDGMQRLNAIFSYIENEYPIEFDGEKGYFDLSTLSFTNQLLTDGILTQKEPKISQSVCTAIMKYPLPLSMINADRYSIETVFRRINSFGRQLSPQEIRQAGATCSFSDIVRQIASIIRGDVSLEDKLSLKDMAKISLSSHNLEYGITMNEIYWVKQNIILICNMRKSKDEEIIAYILTYILLGQKIEPTVKTLNDLYTYDELQSDFDKIEAQVNDSIKKIGQENIIKNFLSVHDFLNTILVRANLDFHDLLFSKKIAKGLVRSYQIVFLALYQLLIDENKEVTDMDALINEFRNVGHDQLSNVAGKEWCAAFRSRKVKAVHAIIKSHFHEKVGEDVAHENWMSQLDTLFRLSKTEGCQYDYKQGLYTLEENGKFETNKLSDYVRTLVAEVNKGPYVKGYVILGVAEKIGTAERIKTLYGQDYHQSIDTKFYITGVQGEINKYLKGDEDNYARKIRSQIKNEPICEYAQNYILTHMKFVSYYSHTILVLELQSQNEPLYYNNEFFERQNNETCRVEGAKDIMALMQRFATSK